MRRIMLGKTGIEVNQLGLGGIPIQRVDEAQAVETVVYALEKGIDFIDTARGYTTSETWIGKALKQVDKKVILATKSFNRTADGVRKDVEKSLYELQTRYIDIYQCHGVRDYEEYQRIKAKGGALEGLIKAKEDGRIGHIGITSHNLDLLEEVIDEGLFETIMVCFSLLEPKACEVVIPKAVEKGIGVIAMKPFSGGVIDNPAIALKFVLSWPEVLALAGVEAKGLVDENWEIFQGDYKLSHDEKTEIEMVRKQYDKRFCRRCDYCQPCSEGIRIQYILGIESLVKRMGIEALLSSPITANVISDAKKCTECRECVPRCPYELPIPDLIKEKLFWLETLERQ
ncbi:MAG: aldo/keto reductase [Deltaproteobacteria bacterium]|nr:aldo/keto reductase [Deltaproteobacteria bacterium]